MFSRVLVPCTSYSFLAILLAPQRDKSREREGRRKRAPSTPYSLLPVAPARSRRTWYQDQLLVSSFSLSLSLVAPHTFSALRHALIYYARVPKTQLRSSFPRCSRSVSRRIFFQFARPRASAISPSPISLASKRTLSTILPLTPLGPCRANARPHSISPISSIILH